MKSAFVASSLFSLAVSTLLTGLVTAASIDNIVIDPDSTIKDSPTTLMGVNHIGLSVKDLDTSLAFYQQATGYKLVRHETIGNNAAADTLFGRAGVEYEIAVLEGPNMLFELIEFKHNANKSPVKMPVEGPGMTHTCFQSSSSDSGYDRFVSAGADVLSRGDEPIDMGGYGVTYAYAYDPDGNMFELEQLDEGPLSEVDRKVRWVEGGHHMWMTQVALVTHDLERLTAWYQKILAFAPYRTGDYVSHPRMIDITDQEDLSLIVSWFRMNDRNKTLEFWQYRNPATPTFVGKRDVTDFGYSYSIEVGDIHAEYARMKGLGVEFISEPVLMGDYYQVYANDVDGNVFALRQWTDPRSPYSVSNLEL